MDRRKFLKSTSGLFVASTFAAERLLEGEAATPPDPVWDQGELRHVLPTVSDSRMLVKASFTHPLGEPPLLRIDGQTVPGRMNDTEGECWQFYAEGLAPARSYELSLIRGDGRALAEPWSLATFPGPDARPSELRVLFYTCAGGVSGNYSGVGDWNGFLPAAIRNRLLRRGLAFQPDAAVANGDHVYWDLHQWRGENVGALSANGRASDFAFSERVFGTRNEAALKAAVRPQIAPVYGTDFRSTPVFFLQDDHDHFENDVATDELITFPVPWFQLQLARATQQLYYPEFLPDRNRPDFLPWSSSTDRGDLSESFGTLRFGRLAEVALFDVRRTMNLNGPSAVFVDRQVEAWLTARASAEDVTHFVYAPSNPPGWSAGKWGEWYPDVLHPYEPRLTTTEEKPYWQEGWLRQHDRLIEALAGARRRVPLIISGDLHALGLGRIDRSGALDLRANPVTTVLSGPVGTSPGAFPSAIRNVGPRSPEHLDVMQTFDPIEEHGFTIADFLPDRIVLRMFRWDANTQPVEAIDSLEPFHVEELGRTT